MTTNKKRVAAVLALLFIVILLLPYSVMAYSPGGTGGLDVTVTEEFLESEIGPIGENESVTATVEVTNLETGETNTQTFAFEGEIRDGVHTSFSDLPHGEYVVTVLGANEEVTIDGEESLTIGDTSDPLPKPGE